MPQPLSALIQNVADRIRTTNTPVVFAESCTAGLISASLARIPGISEFLCGSAVVYQVATKTEWLGISPELLQNEGVVSGKVAAAMATGVLERTPASMLAASVTGHLGPGAPSDQDGLIYIGIAVRKGTNADVQVFRHILPAEMTGLPIADVDTLREWRQWKAVEEVLTHLQQALEVL
ncbi:MAG: pncC [Schlesneria sp.]|nr:pncC [Schlesneria sp.]